MNPYETVARTRKAYAIADWLTTNCPESLRRGDALEQMGEMPVTWWADVATNAGQKVPSHTTVAEVLSILQRRCDRPGRGPDSRSGSAPSSFRSEGAVPPSDPQASATPERPGLVALRNEMHGTVTELYQERARW